MPHRLANLLAAALVLTWCSGARADTYPSRPITIVLGIAAGGITDVTTRLYAEAASRHLGQRVIIENRTGAGGAIAATGVQNATPDGYTLLAFLGSQHAAVPAMQNAPYDPVKGLAPITLLFNLVTFIAVPAESPATSMQELLDLGKTKQGGLLFGSPGQGTPSHLLAAKIGLATKIPMQFIHYRGGNPMMADLITARVDFALPTYTVAKSYIDGKKLRVLAIDAERRWDTMRDVPTLSEVGLGNEKVASWFGLAAPAGTPDDIVQKVRDAFVRASQEPELMQRLADNGTPIVTSSPAEMARKMEEEAANMARLAKQIGQMTN